MTEKKLKELNERLARAVFPNTVYIDEGVFELDGQILISLPNEIIHTLPFTSSMDACIKWLVPELQKQGQMVRIQWGAHRVDDMDLTTHWSAYCSIYDIYHKNKHFEHWAVSNESMPLAFCLAADKYFKGAKP